MTWLALIEVICLVVQSGIPKALLTKLKAWLHKGAKDLPNPDTFTPGDALERLFHQSIHRQPLRSRLRRMLLRVVWRMAMRRVNEIFAHARGLQVELSKPNDEEYAELSDAVGSIEQPD